MKQELKKQIETIISNENADEKEILFQLKNVLYEMELQNQTLKESKKVSDLIAENILQLQQDSYKGNAIKTGFTDFDKMVGGFSLGEFIVVGARPGMGKTQLLVNLSLTISETIPVLYFTFDLSEHLLGCRFLSSLTDISIDKIVQNKLSVDEKTKLKSVENNFDAHKIYVSDSCNTSLSAFKTLCKKHIEENGVQVIVVDYLQMMSSNKFRTHREVEISYISRELKNIAKDFNVCVIASSQLSRLVEQRGGEKKPQLSDLRESGAIEQDADKVIFIYRPDYYSLSHDAEGRPTAGIVELIISKNRSGNLGTVTLLRNATFTNYKKFEGFREDFAFSNRRLIEIDKPPF